MDHKLCCISDVSKELTECESGIDSGHFRIQNLTLKSDFTLESTPVIAYDPLSHWRIRFDLALPFPSSRISDNVRRIHELPKGVVRSIRFPVTESPSSENASASGRTEGRRSRPEA